MHPAKGGRREMKKGTRQQSGGKLNQTSSHLPRLDQLGLNGAKSDHIRPEFLKKTHTPCRLALLAMNRRTGILPVSIFFRRIHEHGKNSVTTASEFPRRCQRFVSHRHRIALNCTELHLIKRTPVGGPLDGKPPRLNLQSTFRWQKFNSTGKNACRL